MRAEDTLSRALGRALMACIAGMTAVAAGASAADAGIGAAVAGTGAMADAAPAGAAGDEGQPKPEASSLFEVAGFGSLAVGGRFKDYAPAGGSGSSVGLADHGAFAVAADLRADPGRQYELFYSRESTDMSGGVNFPRTRVTVEYLHVGGTLLIDDEPRIQPYAVGGLGITRFTPGEQGSTDTRFSAALGLGLRWPVSTHFSVRLEGRGLLTLVNPDAAVFCRSDQAGLLCRIRGNGQTFIQGQFLLGAAYQF